MRCIAVTWAARCTALLNTPAINDLGFGTPRLGGRGKQQRFRAIAMTARTSPRNYQQSLDMTMSGQDTSGGPSDGAFLWFDAAGNPGQTTPGLTADPTTLATIGIGDFIGILKTTDAEPAATTSSQNGQWKSQTANNGFYDPSNPLGEVRYPANTGGIWVPMSDMILPGENLQLRYHQDAHTLNTTAIEELWINVIVLAVPTGG